MSNEKYIAEIEQMDMPTLLREIINEPLYLTDVYYSEFGNAINKRAEQLLQDLVQGDQKP